MSAYYNENDPKAVAWLRELIKAGHIAPGDVDERSIKEVQPEDVRSYTQCHWFAGIGVWSYALRLAGWEDSRPAWSGSCPCQSFSAAGKQEGFSDPRHLWPEWFRLIRECRPVSILSEQVGAAIRHGWLDLVQDNLESIKYTVGSAVMGASSAGAPHIRERVYFVADSENSVRRTKQQEYEDAHRWNGSGRRGNVGELAHTSGERIRAGGPGSPEQAPTRVQGEDRERQRLWSDSGKRESSSRMANPNGRDSCTEREQRSGEYGQQQEDCGLSVMADSLPTGRTEGRTGTGDGSIAGCSEFGNLGDAGSQRLPEQRSKRGILPEEDQSQTGETSVRASSPTNGFWRDAEWIACTDGKSRPVKRGSFPLVAGSSGRMGRSSDPSAPLNAEATSETRIMRLRGYGNSIVAPLAQAFIEAYLEIERA